MRITDLLATTQVKNVLTKDLKIFSSWLKFIFTVTNFFTVGA